MAGPWCGVLLVRHLVHVPESHHLMQWLQAPAPNMSGFNDDSYMSVVPFIVDQYPDNEIEASTALLRARMARACSLASPVGVGACWGALAPRQGWRNPPAAVLRALGWAASGYCSEFRVPLGPSLPWCAANPTALRCANQLPRDRDVSTVSYQNLRMEEPVDGTRSDEVGCRQGRVCPRRHVDYSRHWPPFLSVLTISSPPTTGCYFQDAKQRAEDTTTLTVNEIKQTPEDDFPANRETFVDNLEADLQEPGACLAHWAVARESSRVVHHGAA